MQSAYNQQSHESVDNVLDRINKGGNDNAEKKTEFGVRIYERKTKKQRGENKPVNKGVLTLDG